MTTGRVGSDVTTQRTSRPATLWRTREACRHDSEPVARAIAWQMPIDAVGLNPLPSTVTLWTSERPLRW